MERFKEIQFEAYFSIVLPADDDGATAHKTLQAAITEAVNSQIIDNRTAASTPMLVMRVVESAKDTVKKPLAKKK